MCSKQLEKNTFLAAAIVKPTNGRIPIKILNSSEENVTLPMFDLELEPLQDYEICKSSTQSNVDRVKGLLETLNLTYDSTQMNKKLSSKSAPSTLTFFIVREIN